MKLSTIISIIISALLIACVSLFLSFKFFEINDYKKINANDSIVLKCENRDNLVKELETVQQTVKEISQIGQNGTKDPNMSSEFKTYQTAYDNLNYIVNQISKCQSKFKLVTVDKVSTLYKKQPELIDRLILEQETWVGNYQLFIEDLSTLLAELKPIEEIFYTAKPKDAIQYFNKINSSFLAIEESHNHYIKDLEAYLKTKKELYETIDYIAL